MIAGLVRALKRKLMESEIRDMEREKAAIIQQRAQDAEDEKTIDRELVVMRRHLQALIHEDVQAETARQVRRIRP